MTTLPAGWKLESHDSVSVVWVGPTTYSLHAFDVPVGANVYDFCLECEKKMLSRWNGHIDRTNQSGSPHR